MNTSLWPAILKNRAAFLLIGIFSVFVNFLGLTGPLFMLQVYDRVLPSRSGPTLLILLFLVALLYAALALLDLLRGQVGARVGAAVQAELDDAVIRSTLKHPPEASEQNTTALQDLEAVRRFLSSPIAFTFLDLPFSPVYFAAIFIFHPLLGWLAIGGGVSLTGLLIINQYVSRQPANIATRAGAASARIAEQMRLQADTIRSLGMTAAVVGRWRLQRDAALVAETVLSDRNGGFGAVTRALRLFLQSAMLGLAAWLVINGEMTAGGMIASAILMGRALAPIEQLAGGWASVARATKGWRSLGMLLAASQRRPTPTKLPSPRARLDVSDIAVVPPGAPMPALLHISFSLGPGQALGVIGESAAGKSSLARVLVGLWKPARGVVRLDGASLDQYDEATLSRQIGYLPQDIALFDGTVAENIARLDAAPDSDQVIRAARLAGAHDMILNLPNGYDTVVGQSGNLLSGGHKQRVAFARALYCDPVLVVLDEPDSNLDASGSDAVNAAISTLKAAGKIVVVIAHRSTAIAECDMLLMLKSGRVAALGAKADVLRTAISNRTVPASGPRVVSGAN